MRNGGDWTEARYQSFIKSALRAASRRWPPRYTVLKEACVGKKVNKKTGRIAAHYTCNTCNGEFPASEVQVDHICPIIDPTVGFVDWNSVIEAMFCEKDNLQVLCKPCHSIKTGEEKRLAKERNNERKSK